MCTCTNSIEEQKNWGKKRSEKKIKKRRFRNQLSKDSQLVLKAKQPRIT